MKLPEFLFVVINPVMRFLLRSPLHPILSKSIMVVTFWGRKSGRQFSTPVRYLRDGDVVRCYSSTETQWWRNLRHGARARLLCAGQEHDYVTQVIENDPEAIRAALLHYFSHFPQDAAYHEVKLNRDKSPVEADLDRASREAVVVEARLA